jgi:hypothetical protein
MPEVSRKSLEKGDIIKYERKGYSTPSCGYEGVKIEGISEDGKCVGVEKGNYGGCYGGLISSTSYGVDINSITEVKRWVKVVDGETQDEIIERQKKRIAELEDQIDSLEGDIDKVADAALRGR